MTQQFLDFAKIRTHIEQMRRIAVPKFVRMNAIKKSARTSAPLKNPPNIPSTEPSPRAIRARPLGDKQGLAQNAGPAALIKPRHQGLTGFTRQRNDPLFATFSENSDIAAPKIDITHIESNQLAHPQTGSVQQLDDGPISQSGAATRRGFRVGRIQALMLGQGPAVVYRKRLGGAPR